MTEPKPMYYTETTDITPYQRNNIYCGKSEEMLSHLPDNCIDLTVTSPPYDNLRAYNGFTLDWHEIIKQLYRVTRQGGVVVWVVGDQTVNGSETGTSFRQALWAMECGFRLHDTMIYKTAKPPLSHNRYEQEFEYMFIFSKGTPVNNLMRVPSIYFGIDKRKGGEYTHRNGYTEDKRIRNGAKRSSPNPTKIKGNVWEYKTGAGHSGDDIAFEHPATFPEALARDHIVSWSNPGDLVLDPFCGSGTTAKMAIETGCDYLGFDISQEYVDLALRRVAGAKRPLFNWTAA